MRKIIKFRIGIDQETLERLERQASLSGLTTNEQGLKTPPDQVLNLIKQNVIQAWIDAPRLPQYGPELIPSDRLMQEHQVSLPGELHQKLKELAAFTRLSIRQLCYDMFYLQATCGQEDGKSLPDLSETNLSLLEIRKKTTMPVFKESEDYDAWMKENHPAQPAPPGLVIPADLAEPKQEKDLITRLYGEVYDKKK